MTAQDKLNQYAEENKMNDAYTNQEWLGKAILEGVVIDRTPGTMTVASIKREGKTITVSETTKSEKNEVIDGQLVTTPVQITEEVMVIEL